MEFRKKFLVTLGHFGIYLEKIFLSTYALG